MIVHVTIPRRSFVIHRKKLLGRIAYNDKMDSLVNDKQTYEVPKQDPTPALQRKLNNKLLTLKKTDKIDFRRYSRLRCSVPQPPWPASKLSYLGKRSESRENANNIASLAQIGELARRLQPPKLYGLLKLHKPNIPMRPIVSFCRSPTYKLSKYLTNVLKPLTDESRHKLQSTENFFDAIKTIQIPGRPQTCVL